MHTNKPNCTKSRLQFKPTRLALKRQISPRTTPNLSKFNKPHRQHSVRRHFSNHVIETPVTTSIPSLSACTDTTPRVAIIGSGPAAMYTAKYILQQSPQTHVHIIDRLLTPFGLVRSGIAPDHPEAKNVISDFETNVLAHKNAVFIGGVKVKELSNESPPSATSSSTSTPSSSLPAHAQEVSIQDLYQHYHGVVIATGAATGKTLGLENEHKRGIYDSREFVSWYNGHPDYANLSPPLESTKNVIIIGNGNVSLDIARILLSPKNFLQNTDIALNIRNTFSKSAVQSVYLCARRGVLDAAYTIAELREILTLVDKKWPESGQTSTLSADSSTNTPTKPYQLEFVNVNVTDEDKKTMAANRAINRKTQLLLDHMKLDGVNVIDIANSDQQARITAQEGNKQSRKKLSFVFQAKPDSISVLDGPSESTQSEVADMRFKLMTKENAPNAPFVESQQSFTLPFSHSTTSPSSSDTIIIKSIGYQTTALAGVPFDTRRNIYPTDKGRIIISSQNLSNYHLQRTIGGDTQVQDIHNPSSYPSSLNTNIEGQKDANGELVGNPHQHLKTAGYNIVPFIYATGWARRGPVGILGTNIGDAKETATSVVQDLTQWAKSSSSSSSSTEPLQDGAYQTLPSLPTPGSLWKKYNFFVTSQKEWKNIQLHEQSLAHCHGIQSWIQAEDKNKGGSSVQSVFDAEQIASVKVNQWDDLRSVSTGAM